MARDACARGSDVAGAHFLGHVACDASQVLDFSGHMEGAPEVPLGGMFYPYGFPMVLRTNLPEVFELACEQWGKFAEKGFSVSPQYWFADGDRVVVLVQTSLAGETTDAADVLTFNADGKLVRFQTAGDTAQLERVFGSK